MTVTARPSTLDYLTAFLGTTTVITALAGTKTAGNIHVTGTLTRVEDRRNGTYRLDVQLPNAEPLYGRTGEDMPLTILDNGIPVHMIGRLEQNSTDEEDVPTSNYRPALPPLMFLTPPERRTIHTARFTVHMAPADPAKIPSRKVLVAAAEIAREESLR